MADYKRLTKETERVFLVAITGMPMEVAKAKEAVEKVRFPLLSLLRTKKH